jgi:hypothetical protein
LAVLKSGILLKKSGESDREGVEIPSQAVIEKIPDSEKYVVYNDR